MNVIYFIKDRLVTYAPTVIYLRGNRDQERRHDQHAQYNYYFFHRFTPILQSQAFVNDIILHYTTNFSDVKRRKTKSPAEAGLL